MAQQIFERMGEWRQAALKAGFRGPYAVRRGVAARGEEFRHADMSLAAVWDADKRTGYVDDPKPGDPNYSAG